MLVAIYVALVCLAFGKFQRCQALENASSIAEASSRGANPASATLRPTCPTGAETVLAKVFQNTTLPHNASECLLNWGLVTWFSDINSSSVPSPTLTGTYFLWFEGLPYRPVPYIGTLHMEYLTTDTALFGWNLQNNFLTGSLDVSNLPSAVAQAGILQFDYNAFSGVLDLSGIPSSSSLQLTVDGNQFSLITCPYSAETQTTLLLGQRFPTGNWSARGGLITTCVGVMPQLEYCSQTDKGEFSMYLVNGQIALWNPSGQMCSSAVTLQFSSLKESNTTTCHGAQNSPDDCFVSYLNVPVYEVLINMPTVLGMLGACFEAYIPLACSCGLTTDCWCEQTWQAEYNLTYFFLNTSEPRNSWIRFPYFNATALTTVSGNQSYLFSPTQCTPYERFFGNMLRDVSNMPISWKMSEALRTWEGVWYRLGLYFLNGSAKGLTGKLHLDALPVHVALSSLDLSKNELSGTIDFRSLPASTQVLNLRGNLIDAVAMLVMPAVQPTLSSCDLTDNPTLRLVILSSCMSFPPSWLLVDAGVACATPKTSVPVPRHLYCVCSGTPPCFGGVDSVVMAINVMPTLTVFWLQASNVREQCIFNLALEYNYSTSIVETFPVAEAAARCLLDSALYARVEIHGGASTLDHELVFLDDANNITMRMSQSACPQSSDAMLEAFSTGLPQSWIGNTSIDLWEGAGAATAGSNNSTTDGLPLFSLKAPPYSLVGTVNLTALLVFLPIVSLSLASNPGVTEIDMSQAPAALTTVDLTGTGVSGVMKLPRSTPLTVIVSGDAVQLIVVADCSQTHVISPSAILCVQFDQPAPVLADRWCFRPPGSSTQWFQLTATLQDVTITDTYGVVCNVPALQADYNTLTVPPSIAVTFCVAVAACYPSIGLSCDEVSMNYTFSQLMFRGGFASLPISIGAAMCPSPNEVAGLLLQNATGGRLLSSAVVQTGDGADFGINVSGWNLRGTLSLASIPCFTSVVFIDVSQNSLITGTIDMSSAPHSLQLLNLSYCGITNLVSATAVAIRSVDATSTALATWLMLSSGVFVAQFALSTSSLLVATRLLNASLVVSDNCSQIVTGSLVACKSVRDALIPITETMDLFLSAVWTNGMVTPLQLTLTLTGIDLSYPGGAVCRATGAPSYSFDAQHHLLLDSQVLPVDFQVCACLWIIGTACHTNESFWKLTANASVTVSMSDLRISFAHSRPTAEEMLLDSLAGVKVPAGLNLSNALSSANAPELDHTLSALTSSPLRRVTSSTLVLTIDLSNANISGRVFVQNFLLAFSGVLSVNLSQNHDLVADFSVSSQQADQGLPVLNAIDCSRTAMLPSVVTAAQWKTGILALSGVKFVDAPISPNVSFVGRIFDLSFVTSLDISSNGLVGVLSTASMPHLEYFNASGNRLVLEVPIIPAVADLRGSDVRDPLILTEGVIATIKLLAVDSPSTVVYVPDPENIPSNLLLQNCVVQRLAETTVIGSFCTAGGAVAILTPGNIYLIQARATDVSQYLPSACIVDQPMLVNKTSVIPQTVQAAAASCLPGLQGITVGYVMDKLTMHFKLANGSAEVPYSQSACNSLSVLPGTYCLVTSQQRIILSVSNVTTVVVYAGGANKVSVNVTICSYLSRLLVNGTSIVALDNSLSSSLRACFPTMDISLGGVGSYSSAASALSFVAGQPLLVSLCVPGVVPASCISHSAAVAPSDSICDVTSYLFWKCSDFKTLLWSPSSGLGALWSTSFARLREHEASLPLSVLAPVELLSVPGCSSPRCPQCVLADGCDSLGNATWNTAMCLLGQGIAPGCLIQAIATQESSGDCNNSTSLRSLLSLLAAPTTSAMNILVKCESSTRVGVYAADNSTSSQPLLVYLGFLDSSSGLAVTCSTCQTYLEPGVHSQPYIVALLFAVKELIAAIAISTWLVPRLRGKLSRAFGLLLVRVLPYSQLEKEKWVVEWTARANPPVYTRDDFLRDMRILRNKPDENFPISFRRGFGPTFHDAFFREVLQQGCWKIKNPHDPTVQQAVQRCEEQFLMQSSYAEPLILASDIELQPMNAVLLVTDARSSSLSNDSLGDGRVTEGDGQVNEINSATSALAQLGKQCEMERVIYETAMLASISSPKTFVIIYRLLFVFVQLLAAFVDTAMPASKYGSSGASAWTKYEAAYFAFVNSSSSFSLLVLCMLRSRAANRTVDLFTMVSLLTVAPPLVTHVLPGMVLYFPVTVAAVLLFFSVRVLVRQLPVSSSDGAASFALHAALHIATITFVSCLGQSFYNWALLFYRREEFGLDYWTVMEFDISGRTFDCYFNVAFARVSGAFQIASVFV